MKRFLSEREAGFTLLELLMVVVVIGVLAMIAMSQFSAYRRRGFEAQLQTDLKNAAIAQEAYFSQNHTYKSGSLSGTTLSGYNRSTQITGMNAVTGANTFVLTATHANCSSVPWSYDSATGAINGAACS